MQYRVMYVVAYYVRTLLLTTLLLYTLKHGSGMTL